MSRRWKRRLAWAAAAVIGLVVLGYGAIFLYAKVLNDSPDALGESDLDSALVDSTTAPAVGTVLPPTGTGSAPVRTDANSAKGSVDFDGEWVATDASEFGYRVEEIIAGVDTTAVGRSNEIDATLKIEGTVATALDVEVPVETIKSHEFQRDNRFRNQVMSIDEFPTASFVLTEAIDVGSIPVGDRTVTVAATGDLTLRGVTREVTFDVTAQTRDGRIGVLGSIPVEFADYGIDNPSFGRIRTEDHGLVEFLLVFERR